MDASEMKDRTKAFAVNVAKLTQKLPENPVNRAYVNQIIRSSSSVGANYRAARRAKSNADFNKQIKNRRRRAGRKSFLFRIVSCF
jgi:four helix bundle protein